MSNAKIVQPIHIIGVGCAGMRVARSLDELGSGRIVSDLHFWDGDSVDDGNVRAQLYEAAHMGMPKVEAAQLVVPKWANLSVTGHNSFVNGAVELSGIVFVCVDSMTSRKTIWETCIKGKEDVSLMIEMRLNTDTATVNIVDPCEPLHQEMWEHYWYPDDDAAGVISCGAATSLGPIANVAADIAVWQLVRFCEIVAGNEDRLHNQVQIQMRPPHIESFVW